MNSECQGCGSFTSDLRDGCCQECRGCDRCKCCSVSIEFHPCWTNCDEGFVDAYDEDPINESPGTLEVCRECRGNGGHSVVRCLGDCDETGQHAATRSPSAGGR
jgi:hypothetical protein